MSYYDHGSLNVVKCLRGEAYLPAVVIMGADGRRHVPTFEFRALVRHPGRYQVRPGALNESVFGRA